MRDGVVALGIDGQINSGINLLGGTNRFVKVVGR
jgi:hypothetical protein